MRRGSVLQIYALLSRGGGDGRLTEKIVSVAVSALTTGLTSASICYE
jgi:hypothetical protein